MIVLGLILLLIGYFVITPISGLLTTVGAILLIVGLVLFVLGAVGRPVRGRSRWY